ncbi:unnamed protein product [Anisakis simplex]|uniref:ShKT domain-containing protein n=1 Tax=Anisakis simplex TaxID=6269 RepID=A0A0M3J8C6_ANISI|nr:unnamed protein product [Anisakis simplex]
MEDSATGTELFYWLATPNRQLPARTSSRIHRGQNMFTKIQVLICLALSVVLIVVLANAEECKDANPDCVGRDYVCTEYKDYAAQYCKKTCNLCGGGNGGEKGDGKDEAGSGDGDEGNGDDEDKDDGVDDSDNDDDDDEDKDLE